MSERPCLHCTLLAVLIEHFSAEPGIEANEAVEALGQLIGEVLGGVEGRRERLALTAKLGAIVAAVSVRAVQAAPQAVH